MEGRNCSGKSQRNRIHKSMRYAAKGKGVLKPAGKILELSFFDRRKGRFPVGLSKGFFEKKEKRRRMCYNWCNQFMQSFFMSGIGKRLPGKIREAQGRQRKHIPFSGPLFA